MKVTGEPFHLPRCPINPDAYNRLYSFNQDTDDQMPEDFTWQQVRIKPGSSEIDTYRLLPSAFDFEFSGYLTRSRIRFFSGDSTSAGMLMAKPCTFHSHPTKNPLEADIPSLMDIFSFLNYRHLRTITVGASRIWVWDKTRATLVTVRKMAAWIEANHFRVVTRLMKKDFSSWQNRYVEAVMKHLGWVMPRSIHQMYAAWPEILRNRFKIRARVFNKFSE